MKWPQKYALVLSLIAGMSSVQSVMAADSSDKIPCYMSFYRYLNELEERQVGIKIDFFPLMDQYIDQCMKKLSHNQIDALKSRLRLVLAYPRRSNDPKVRAFFAKINEMYPPRAQTAQQEDLPSPDLVSGG